MRGSTATSNRQGVEPYLTAFSQFEAGLNGKRASHVHELRRAGIARFAETGFPTTRDEEWRFTNVAPITRLPFRFPDPQPVETPSAEQVRALCLRLFGAEPASLLVFVNGRRAGHLSSTGATPGLVVGSLSSLLNSHATLVEPHLGHVVNIQSSAFAALNTAFLDDGAFIHIGRGRAAEEPIHLLFISTAGADPVVSHPRILIVAEDSSRAAVVEAYASSGSTPCFTNAVTEIAMGENAVLDHYKVQQDTDSSYHIAMMGALLGQSSQFSSHSFSLGGGLVRNDVSARLNSEGIECTLNGLYLGAGEQVVDNHTAIDHAMPHCNSHEVYHGVLGGKASGVFNGKIFVRQDAQKTDAKQTNRTLLLSDEATIDTKPQLEIFADDVRCTHGATIGRLDENALFYLRARGIPKAAAENLLTYAFANEIVERVKVKPLRDGLEKLIFDWLDRARGAQHERR